MTVQYVAQVVTASHTYSMPLSGHEWDDTGGYFAPVVAWLMPASYATAIMTDLGILTGSAREVSLNLGDPNDAAHYVQVSRVVVIGTAPADNPQETFLLMSDVRWYFTRRWFACDGNLRRRVGETSLIGDTPTSQTPVNTIAWAPWAINNPTFSGGVTSQGAPWTWTTFANAVLTYLTNASSARGLPAITFTLDSFSVLNFAAQILQETTLDGDANNMIARAIESIPGASIRVALNGTIHVYETTPSAETSFCSSLPAPLWGMGNIALIDRSGLRPRSGGWWRTYLDMELELRLTYNPDATVSVNDPFLCPVIQVTDKSLTIPAGTYLALGPSAVAARTVGQYSWIGQDEAFAAWYGNKDGAGAAIYGASTPSDIPCFGFSTPVGFSGPLTDDIVALEWFGPGLDQIPLDPLLSGLPNPVWVSRIAALKGAYRTYFRANPYAWDRIRHAWDTRCSIWDAATGTRADSPVYCNYSYVPVDPTIDSNYPDGMVNNIGYATSGILDDMVPTGFVLELVEEELGIFAVNRTGSTTQARLWKAQKIEVSDVVTIPSMDATGGAATPNSVSEVQLQPSDAGPSTDWKLATVISVSPGAPNDPRRFYEVKLDTATVAAAAGWNGYALAGHGPDVELRTQLGEARIAWRDDSTVANGILATLAFNDGTGGGNPAIGIGGASGATQDPLNYVEVTGGVYAGTPPLYGGTATNTGLVPINQVQEVIPLAVATAVADFLTKIDCYVGTQRIPGTKTAKPIGTVRKVVHRVTADRFESEIHAVEPDQHQFRAQDFLAGAPRANLLQTIARLGRG